MTHFVDFVLPLAAGFIAGYVLGPILGRLIAYLYRKDKE